jgi:hypothetical protein
VAIFNASSATITPSVVQGAGSDFPAIRQAESAKLHFAFLGFLSYPQS